MKNLGLGCQGRAKPRGQQDANLKIYAFLFPEPLTATGEGIAWQLGYPSHYFTQKILCHSRLTLHLGQNTRGNRYRHSSSAHSSFCRISLVSDASHSIHSITPFPCSCKLSSALFPKTESLHLTMHLVGLAYLFMHDLGM